MTLESALLFLTTLFFYSIKPGPGMMAMVSLVLRNGIVPGLFYQLACVLVEVLYFILAASGYSILAQNAPFIAILLRTLGATYIIYLGIKGFWTSFETISEATPQDKNMRTYWEGFVSGFLVMLGNPIVIVFYAGIIPMLFDSSHLDIRQILIGALLVIIVLLPVYLSNALFAVGLKHVLKSPKNFKMVNIVSSLVMIAAGLIIGFSVFIEIFWT